MSSQLHNQAHSHYIDRVPESPSVDVQLFQSGTTTICLARVRAAQFAAWPLRELVSHSLLTYMRYMSPRVQVMAVKALGTPLELLEVDIPEVTGDQVDPSPPNSPPRAHPWSACAHQRSRPDSLFPREASTNAWVLMAH